MTALVMADAIGRAAVGGGPQRLGQRRRDHSTPADTHVAEAAAVPLTLGFARSKLDTLTPTTALAAVDTASDPFFLDHEKVVWDWPDHSVRLIEEFR